MAGVAIPLAHAAPKDGDAQKLDKQAMDDDYLNVRFAEAAKKLRDALNVCGPSGCDPKIKARIYIHLGIILVNDNKQADGTAAFTEALKLDPSAAPEADYASDPVKKAYDAAKSSAPAAPANTTPPAGTGTGATPPAGPADNDLKHEPITEAQVGYPVPIYVGAADGASRFVLFYKAPGADFTKIELKKMGKGYGVEIPCKDVKIAGKIKYYIQALDAQGDSVGGAGSKKAPLEFDLKQKISGEIPAFPGKDPPEKCKGGGDCPPGMKEAGCGDKKKYGEKCSGPGQCDPGDGLACVEGTCQPGKEEGGDEGDGGDEGGEAPKLNLFTIAFSIDDAIISGTDLCSSENSVNGTYVCFRQDQGQRYYVPATAGKSKYDETITNTNGQIVANKGDPVNVSSREKGSVSGPPFALGTFRVLIGYDRAIPLKGQAFTPAVGVRLGYAFGGGPAVPNAQDGDKKFMPFHLEARGTMFFGKNVLSKRGVRPFAFVSGGIAQVDAKIGGVPVSNDCDLDGKDQSCPTPRTKIQVDAYRKMGTGFAAIGGGMFYAINKASSLMIEVKASAFFGSSGFAISPTLGFVQQL